jgi:hypothetical protein
MVIMLKVPKYGKYRLTDLNKILILKKLLSKILTLLQISLAGKAQRTEGNLLRVN